MKIKSIILEEFKRFKNLIISDLPETAKMVVLIGPNGCGKSSLLDAFAARMRLSHYGLPGVLGSYYSRCPDLSENIGNRLRRQISMQFHQEVPDVHGRIPRHAVYVRTAHRNTPAFSITGLTKRQPILEDPGVARMIDDDRTTQANYERLYSSAMEMAFESMPGGSTLHDFRETVVREIRESMQNLFPEIVLNSLGNPLSKGTTFRFDKGEIAGFDYENLSGGEKSAFDLILDMIIKRQEYNDTIFCIDEPESHVSMRLQGKLLSVLYDLIPANCQLWIATHSIGMMREAYRLQQEDSDQVVFLDFDNRDFDELQEIKPAKMTRDLWERAHKVVLGDLANLVMPDTVYLCESPLRKSFDADCYNQIFAEKYPAVKFVSTGSKHDLERVGDLLSTALKLNIVSLRDGDNATDQEISEHRARGVKVLSRKCIEEYLLDEEVFRALFRVQEWEASDSELKEIADVIGKADNSKDAAQRVLEHFNRWCKEHRFGDNRDAFLKHTLAPLIKPGMSVYEALERDVFGDGATE